MFLSMILFRSIYKDKTYTLRQRLHSTVGSYKIINPPLRAVRARELTF